MFERFTERARKVIVLAQEEARLLNHNYIGTEHLLLGLVHEGKGVAAVTIEALALSLEDVRVQIERMIGEGQSPPRGHIPFTPRAKKVLEMSLREALDLGHNYIGTEHILLGIVREGEGVAAQALVKLGADLSRVRALVLDVLGGKLTAGEGTTSEGSEVAFALGGTKQPAGPKCPRCRSDLKEKLAVEWIEREGVRLMTTYCGVCGELFGVRADPGGDEASSASA